MEKKAIAQWQFMHELAHLCNKYEATTKPDFAVLSGTLIGLLAATNAAVQLSSESVYDTLYLLQEFDDRKPEFRVK